MDAVFFLLDTNRRNRVRFQTNFISKIFYLFLELQRVLRGADETALIKNVSLESTLCILDRDTLRFTGEVADPECDSAVFILKCKRENRFLV